MEGEPVVDADDHVVDAIVQAMATLAVGVVGEHVERRELTEPVEVLLEQREVVLLGIVIDESLQRAGTERAVVAHHRDRHNPPAQRARQLVRRNLSVAQGAVGKVPEGPLAAPRLVDRANLDPVGLHLHEERGVGCVAHPADHLELTAPKDLGELVGRQFQRGHRWPAGSIG